MYCCSAAAALGRRGSDGCSGTWTGGRGASASSGVLMYIDKEHVDSITLPAPFWVRHGSRRGCCHASRSRDSWRGRCKGSHGLRQTRQGNLRYQTCNSVSAAHRLQSAQRVRMGEGTPRERSRCAMVCRQGFFVVVRVAVQR